MDRRVSARVRVEFIERAAHVAPIDGEVRQV
jgi:hypothetical protein